MHYACIYMCIYVYVCVSAPAGSFKQHRRSYVLPACTTVGVRRIRRQLRRDLDSAFLRQAGVAANGMFCRPPLSVCGSINPHAHRHPKFISVTLCFDVFGVIFLPHTRTHTCTTPSRSPARRPRARQPRAGRATRERHVRQARRMAPRAHTFCAFWQ